LIGHLVNKHHTQRFITDIEGGHMASGAIGEKGPKVDYSSLGYFIGEDVR